METVHRVRALLAAGLPTRTIRQILPCTHDTALRPCPGVLTSLRDQLDVLDQRAADLETARRLLRRTIAATENTADGLPAPGTRTSTPR
ncbi:MerR family DNA-binding protein [Streptomyces longwoodensis]|uniref:MerR family DNA-binding protein n=1 Tax=Streptomyces longwoodensis TaxID=68231 RepID=UPI003409825F